MTKVILEVTDFYLRAENGLVLTICGNRVRELLLTLSTNTQSVSECPGH